MSTSAEKLEQGSNQQIDVPAKAAPDETPSLEKKLTKRLVSLDAYRGMIMICLISVGFGLSAFEGHPYLVPLLLPEDADFHPLLKDFTP